MVAYAPPELDHETGEVVMPESFKVFYHEDRDCEDCSEGEVLAGGRVYDECPNAVQLYHNKMLSKKVSEDNHNPAAKSSGTRKEKRAAADRDGKSKTRKKRHNTSKTSHREREHTEDHSLKTLESDSQDSDSDTVNDSGSVYKALQTEVPTHSEEECLNEICQVSARLTQLKNARNQLERQLKENAEEERKAKARLLQLSSWVKSYS